MTGFESLYGCFEGCTHWVSRTAEGLGAYSSIVRIVLWGVGLVDYFVLCRLRSDAEVIGINSSY